MALLRCDFSSEVLRMDSSMTVILPQDARTPFSPEPAPVDTAPPVLYLLHGAGDNNAAWSRFTSVERYAQGLGLAVVMPEVARSYYTDQVHGQRYWTFLSEELPALAESFFQLSTRREDTFVAGLSMGGYGALTWALRHPERFAAAASLSGVLGIAQVRRRRDEDREATLHAAFGDGELAGTDHDPHRLLSVAVAGGTRLPDLYVGCGEGDGMYEDNTRFVSAATELGVRVTTDFGPGKHDWDYWDSAIQRVLDWLPIRPIR